MTRKVTLFWTDPAAPLTGVEVGMRVLGDTGAFTTLPVVAPGVQTLLIGDLEVGPYEFAVTVLNASKRSPGVTLQVAVADVVVPPVDVVPGDVTGLHATVV